MKEHTTLTSNIAAESCQLVNVRNVDIEKRVDMRVNHLLLLFLLLLLKVVRSQETSAVHCEQAPPLAGGTRLG